MGLGTQWALVTASVSHDSQVIFLRRWGFFRLTANRAELSSIFRHTCRYIVNRNSEANKFGMATFKKLSVPHCFAGCHEPDNMDEKIICSCRISDGRNGSCSHQKPWANEPPPAQEAVGEAASGPGVQEECVMSWASEPPVPRTRDTLLVQYPSCWGPRDGWAT